MRKHLVHKQKGFTLIEMLIAVAIFALVLLVAMGAILTIIDANRKSRTLTTVMNNVTFMLDNLTRTVKSGTNMERFNGGGGLRVCAIDLGQNDPEGFTREYIFYRHNTTDKTIERCVVPTNSCDSAPSSCSGYSPLLSDDVVINDLNFEVIADGSVLTDPAEDEAGRQPRVLITVDGVVTENRVESDFSLQTTVTQRRLNIE